jgi:hypothetical protein
MSVPATMSRQCRVVESISLPGADGEGHQGRPKGELSSDLCIGRANCQGAECNCAGRETAGAVRQRRVNLLMRCRIAGRAAVSVRRPIGENSMIRAVVQ